VKDLRLSFISVCLILVISLHGQTDSVPHKIRLVTVEKNVEIEVVDWGGSGQVLILLPGLGDTAHVFDELALKLIHYFHVYGITPRGFGVSSAPQPEAGSYSADRLGDDIVAVIGVLKLDHPILAGHSIAGEVLSEAEYKRRGWKMFPSIGRVYVNDRARGELGWEPRYDFNFVIGRLRAGDDLRSPLAQVIGSKGYHSEVFSDGPYPVE
jgi:pimeloyl-ACP methyl ester carboxylesterase